MIIDGMPFLFWLKKLISPFLLPPLLPLLMTIVGLLLFSRYRRTGLTLTWSGVILTFLSSTSVGADLLLRPLEQAPPITAEQARGAQAIVILGGGRQFNAPEFDGETVSAITLQRLRYGARLARELQLPVLVSGGAVSGRYTEAALMRDVLEQEFYVPVRWTETASLDTRDNARNTAALLQEENFRHIVLVTHASHIPRATKEFEQTGMNVIAAPTAWSSSRPHENTDISEWLPDASAALAVRQACHEWLGRLAYRLSR